LRLGTRSHENRKARGDYSTDARIATQSWQTVARFDPNANRPKHRVRNRPTSAMTKQDCDRRRQNRSAGARPSIGGTKSVTRDTATKVRYRGQRFTHAARSCLDARSQPHNPEPHRDGDTEFARNDEMNVRGHVDVTGSTAVISRRGRGMRWRRRGLGLRDSRNEQWL